MNNEDLFFDEEDDAVFLEVIENLERESNQITIVQSFLHNISYNNARDLLLQFGTIDNDNPLIILCNKISCKYELKQAINEILNEIKKYEREKTTKQYLQNLIISDSKITSQIMYQRCIGWNNYSYNKRLFNSECQLYDFWLIFEQDIKDINNALDWTYTHCLNMQHYYYNLEYEIDMMELDLNVTVSIV